MSDQIYDLPQHPAPRRFRFSLLSLFIVTTICCVLAAWLFRPRPLEAVALLYVSATVPQIVDSGNVEFDAEDYRTVQSAMTRLAVSDVVLNRALQDKNISEAVKSQAGDDAEFAAWLRRRLRVEFIAKSEILRWTFIGKPRTAEKSSIILDGLVRTFLAEVRDKQKQEYTRQIDALIAQKTELESHIEELSQQTYDLEQSKGSDDPQLQLLKREAQTSLTDIKRIRADILNLEFARDVFKQIELIQPATIVNP